MASQANPEAKWRKLPAAQCLLLLGFAAISFIIALCAALAVLKKKKKRVPVNQVEEQQRGVTSADITTLSSDGTMFFAQKQGEPFRLGNWGLFLKALVGSVCCSGSNNWAEFQSRNQQESMPVRDVQGSAMSPVWQRPILMGERCKLPRFSGLILYDEKGRLLQSYNSNKSIAPQDKPAAVTTTLKDLL